MKMPSVKNPQELFDSLTGEFKKIAQIVVKKNGQIRASKPKVTDDPVTGKAAYVWRMVAFMVSPKAQHQCVPVAATFDIPAEVNGRWSSVEADKIAKELDVLVDKIVDCVPKEQWHSVHRWAKAMYGF